VLRSVPLAQLLLFSREGLADAAVIALLCSDLDRAVADNLGTTIMSVERVAALAQQGDHLRSVNWRCFCRLLRSYEVSWPLM